MSEAPWRPTRAAALGEVAVAPLCRLCATRRWARPLVVDRVDVYPSLGRVRRLGERALELHFEDGLCELAKSGRGGRNRREEEREMRDTARGKVGAPAAQQPFERVDSARSLRVEAPVEHRGA